jgi:hypothetical protein
VNARGGGLAATGAAAGIARRWRTTDASRSKLIRFRDREDEDGVTRHVSTRRRLS